MNRIPYSLLSKRQQKRRRRSYCERAREMNIYSKNDIPAAWERSSTKECIEEVEETQLIHDNSKEQHNGRDMSIAALSECSPLNITAEDKVESALRKWLADCPTVPNSHVSILLHHLSSYFPGIILTGSTLKNEKRFDVVVRKMYHGRYAHCMNWQSSVVKYLNAINYKENVVNITVNIDGIPLFEDSRKNHAYPILIQLCTSKPKIICVGFYLSESPNSNKMPDVNEFLRLFVDELGKMIAEGCIISTHRVGVKIRAFVCDAVSRADLKKIVNHNAYNSCERCQQHGIYAGGHVVLPDTDAKLRTDQDFLCKLDISHHKPGPLSIITELGIGLVTSFALDYMHLVLLGVTKRILGRWKHRKQGEVRCHLSLLELEKIDEILSLFSNHVTSDFARKLTGGLKSLAFWKATELRLFLLYAVFLLSEVIPKPYYENLLYLSLGIRILLSKNQEPNIENARMLLKYFVHTASKTYGISFLSYNVHSVIHLPDDYASWVSLDTVSCFKFENYLGSCVKGRLSGRNKPLEQLCRHLSAENDHINQQQSSSNAKDTLTLPDGTVLKSGNVGDRDNCIMMKTGCLGTIMSIGKKLTIAVLEKSSLFEEPLKSELLGIYLAKPSNLTKSVVVEEVHCKMMLLPKENNFIAIKLIHS